MIKFKFHHSTLARGYIAVNNNTYASYNGRYGIGVVCERHNYDSTNYYIKDYYIIDGEPLKNMNNYIIYGSCNRYYNNPLNGYPNRIKININGEHVVIYSFLNLKKYLNKYIVVSCIYIDNILEIIDIKEA